MGMTMAPKVTMSLFSTRKFSSIKGLEDYADLFKTVRDPRVVRHSTEGVCAWCLSNLSIEGQAECDHNAHEGGNRSQDNKAETIRQIIASLGIDSGLYAQEGNNLLFDTARKVCSSQDVENALQVRVYPQGVTESPFYRLDAGFDANGGGQDTFGIVIIGYRRDGTAEVRGRGTKKIMQSFYWFCCRTRLPMCFFCVFWFGHCDTVTSLGAAGPRVGSGDLSAICVQSSKKARALVRRLSRVSPGVHGREGSRGKSFPERLGLAIEVSMTARLGRGWVISSSHAVVTVAFRVSSQNPGASGRVSPSVLRYVAILPHAFAATALACVRAWRGWSARGLKLSSWGRRAS
jgi:hypothetical protein